MFHILEETRYIEYQFLLIRKVVVFQKKGNFFIIFFKFAKCSHVLNYPTVLTKRDGKEWIDVGQTGERSTGGRN